MWGESACLGLSLNRVSRYKTSLLGYGHVAASLLEIVQEKKKGQRLISNNGLTSATEKRAGKN